MYKCIGKRYDEHRQLVECQNTSDSPSRADRPEWGYLCETCSGGKAKFHKMESEPTNLAAMQCDPEEFRDQIESGFMAGMREGDREET